MTTEQVILDRFRYRCHIAGSVQPGYGMRAQAIRYGQPEHPGVDIDAGLAAMVEKGWLKQNPAGTWYYLTPDGAEQVKALRPTA
ncbi:MAG TPA: hypothetical protein VEW48_23425 [Thermoanaerobaculia bacterium]|nr:hypothetical protein [Thermoanaerobaculia bacterium]